MKNENPKEQVILYKFKLTRHLPKLLTLKTQRISRLLGDNSFIHRRSGKQLASTVLLISVSTLPYTDILVSNFIDLKEYDAPRFQNLSYATWAYTSAISPMLVLLVSKFFKPSNWGYIPFFYINVSQVFAYLIMQNNIEIESDWLFRAFSLLLTLILFISGKIGFDFYKKKAVTEDIMTEFLKSRKDYERKN